MGTDGGEDRAESYRRECKKRISKVYGKKLKFVPNVPHVPIQNVIVYTEISDDRRYGFLYKLRKGRFASAKRSFYTINQARLRGGGMPRARSPKRDEAYKIWIDSCGKKKLKDIASDLGVSETQIRKWKNLDKWNSNVTNQSKGNVTKRKRGGQPGNHNATGPPGNKNAEKFGFFSKYLPEETVSIIQEMPTDPLDILWDQIQISYAAIIRAQQIMYVKDKNDKTIEKVEEKDGNVIGEKWEVQQAWDKQANFLQAQARAMSDLRGSIRQYDDLLHKQWDLATDEQKARIEQMKANTDRLRRDSTDEEEDGVEILNDTAEKETGKDIGDHHPEVS